MYSKNNFNKIKEVFDKKGYVNINSFFSDDDIGDLIECSSKIKQHSMSGLWKYIKIYREYPKIKFLNVFGVEYPLNKKLNEKTYSAFNKLCYKDFFCNLLGWNNFETTLIRLHLNSNFFNYQGEWHRDDSAFPSPNKVQTVIYLKDEKGFKIIPKDKNHLLKNYGINPHGKIEKNQVFYDLKDDVCDYIDAKKGDMLIFEAGLLHQGFVKGTRMHYHVRHEKRDYVSKVVKNNPFNITEKYLPDYDPDREGEYFADHYFKTSIMLKLIRLKTLILYFFPRFKYLFKNFFKKKNNRSSIFHSTLWQ